jgi:outer membrane receptor for ferrienterochelin and colicins
MLPTILFLLEVVAASASVEEPGASPPPSPPAQPPATTAEAPPPADDAGKAAEKTPDLTEIPIEDLVEIRVDTVYGASRHAEEETEAPAAVTLITADDIRKYGYRNLADILRSIRGLHVTYDRNYSYLGVRGFGLPGDYNTRVLILVDGHRINDDVYDQGFIGNEFPLDVDLIDRVEFIHGPASSLYGSNAFFGVVNIFTKGARKVGSPELAASAGSFGTYQGRGSFGKSFPNGLDLLFSATGFDSQGQSFHYEEFDAPGTRNGFARNRDHEDLQSLFSRAAYKDLSLAGAFITREKQVPTASFGTIFNDAGEETRDTRYYADLKYEHEFEGQLGVMARLYYDGYHFRGDYPLERDDGGALSRVLNQDSADGQWWGTEVQARKQVLPRLGLTLGGEFRDNVQQDQGNIDVFPRLRILDDRRTSWIIAGYGQGELKILENLILNAGARYDHYSTFGDTVNPRAGLMYKALPKTTFKLLYGRAFRAPNAYELYYNDGTSSKPNPGLDPETIDTYEAVYEQYLGKRYKLLASGFHYDISDLIVQEADPADGHLVFRNSSSVQANGGGLELEARWTNGIRGRASYTFARTEDGDGRRLTNSPFHLAKLNLILPLALEKLFGGVEVQYTSPRRTQSGGRTGDALVLNVTLFTENIVKDLEFSASVYNLLDFRYGDPGGGEHLQDEIEQDGIGFRLKLTYRF